MIEIQFIMKLMIVTILSILLMVWNIILTKELENGINYIFKIKNK